MKGKNTKRGSTSKAKITPKHKREGKTPTQIQNSSLGPKPFINCVKQIRQGEKGENPSLKEASMMTMARLKMDKT